jgi:predicted outer membrane protein
MIKARPSLMKLPVLSTLCIAATVSVAFAQAPATTPPGTPPAPGAAPATTAGASAADKPVPLSSNDKAFLKKVLDGMFFEMKLTDKQKRDEAKLEDTKKVTDKMNKDLNKIWGELASLVDPKEHPTDLPAGDKSKAQRISKAGDKYDKELLEVLEKETKQIEKAFETASKNSQHPGIKTIAANWLPTIRGHSDEIDKASKAAAKQK